MDLKHAGETYIWDMDGTLIDSYDVITSSVVKVTEELGHPADYESVLCRLKQASLTVFIREWTALYGGDPDSFVARYREVSYLDDDRIPLVPGAEETLHGLLEQGARHFIYTHRGASTHRILNRLGITDLFGEIVTSEAGFPSKPAPDGVKYFLDKYKSDPVHTFYVGDRNLDIGCAFNAGVHGILYLEKGSYVQPDGREDRIIRHLTELLD